MVHLPAAAYFGLKLFSQKTWKYCVMIWMMVKIVLVSGYCSTELKVRFSRVSVLL